ncbi:MAG: sulfotransferase domain-containing protein [Deltaproteobacteria bacterium]|nr:sulfotransferase domain-containing protein [Deltaproteobacteria bacterium]
MPSLNKWTRKRIVLLRKLFLRNNVALASFPRSGNTWLSKLLEALSGQQMGSIYRDHVFPRPATGIVIKTHKLDGQRYNRVVHLVRNPLDSISSHHDYMHRYFPERAEPWEAHVETQSREWKKHTDYWLHRDQPRIAIRYEDLIAEPIQQLKKLAAFLNLDVDDTEVEQAIEACKIDKLRDASQKRGEDAVGFFRQGGSGHGIDRYSSNQIAALQADLGNLMDQFGYKIPSNAE